MHDTTETPPPRASAARPETEAFIGFGANMPSPAGAPHETVAAALRLLERAGASVKSISRLRGTRAHPPGSGPDFVNGVAEVAAPGSAEALLTRLHEVEAALGRPPRDPEAPRWRARGVDLDLLSWGDRVAPDRAEVARWMEMSDADCVQTLPTALLLPHPRLHLRAFVLDPLAEIAPKWRHPILDATAAELLDALDANARSGVWLRGHS